jgi:predicted RNase H-related nuclease YkuK (DUF458 family)
MKVFKTISGETVDVVQHTLGVLKEHPICEIHIGTDSQVRGRRTVYVTVIAYRYGIRGAHYIYNKEIVDHKIKDTWSRLWGETERSVEVAQWFQSKINVPVTLDMDFNQDEHFESFKLISASQGWAVSLGYKVSTKPDIQIATKAADHHCKSGKLPRRRRKGKARTA